MALTDTNDIVMPVQPMYGGYGNGGGFGGFGGDWGSLIVLFLIAAMFGGFGGGFGFGGFGGGLGYDFPWLLNGQAGVNANTNARFDNAAISGQLNGIQSAITNGFSSAEVAACGRAYASYEGRGGRSYARGNGRGRGTNARRDSMGRYSSDAGMIEDLRELMEEAEDEQTRKEFQRFISKIETM